MSEDQLTASDVASVFVTQISAFSKPRDYTLVQMAWSLVPEQALDRVFLARGFVVWLGLYLARPRWDRDKSRCECAIRTLDQETPTFWESTANQVKSDVSLSQPQQQNIDNVYQKLMMTPGPCGYSNLSVESLVN
ncbi:unnamed protein product [Clonostachys rhizophaga]|uniref:Uncharacterized protein n=1 Tax=Clonostachys rhizophaga TaxID=160324 RepID=A0A9N9YGG5_9HYPO|nr:unnamed protein product [Clonostachys rhizophaga]